MIRPAVNESILAIIVLFVLAGCGIVVIDAYIIRRIRRLGPPKDDQAEEP